MTIPDYLVQNLLDVFCGKRRRAWRCSSREALEPVKGTVRSFLAKFQKLIAKHKVKTLLMSFQRTTKTLFSCACIFPMP